MKPAIKPSPTRSRVHGCGRDRIWQAIRELGHRSPGDDTPATFTMLDIEHRCREKLGAIRSYLKALKKAGYVGVVGAVDNSAKGKRVSTKFQPALHALLKDSLETPHVRQDGTEVFKGRAREQMWRAMRMLPDFSHRDLAFYSSTEDHPVTPGHAKDYVQTLFKAGYLQRVSDGGPNTLARYRLIQAKYSGPRPPMIQRTKQVYDPNLQQVVWSNSESE